MNSDELHEAIARKSHLINQLENAKMANLKERIIPISEQAAELEGHIAAEYLRLGRVDDAIVNMISQSSCLVDAGRLQNAIETLLLARKLSARSSVSAWIDAEVSRLNQRLRPSIIPHPAEMVEIDVQLNANAHAPGRRVSEDSVLKSSERSNAIFPTTHWTTLLLPIAERTDGAHAALEKLMEAYRKPIVRFVATQIRDKQRAEEVAHDFIERMLERGDLAKADRTKGRFRSFLARSITNFVKDLHAAENALKRGNPDDAVSIDSLETEPGHSQHGEQEFIQHWLRATLEKVERSLRAEWQAAGKAELYDDLLPLLWDRKDGPPIQVIAAKYKLAPSSVSVRKLRLRDRYREILVALIRETVSSPAEVEDEIRFLLKGF